NPGDSVHIPVVETRTLGESMTCWSRPSCVRSMFLMRSPFVAEGTRRVRMDTKTPSAHPHPSVANRDIRSARTGIFRQEGEYWTIGYGGHVVRLKATKGVAYSPNAKENFCQVESHV